MLPAYLANMAPVIVKNRLKALAKPIDFGKNIFGNNKTFRGLIIGVLFSIMAAYIQSLLYGLSFFRGLSLIDYSNWLLAGTLFGAGALFGDLIESFVKRRIRIKPGTRFVPWDQLDFVIGALAAISLIASLTFDMIAIILVMSVIGHITVNHIAYSLGIRREKW
ncbi:CDP-archaeol synthase [Candidatus Woesearchaeota archaeon]|nr:CDP-archaeol synthase [Candidatus Woesearchaeota archaeon]